MKEKWDYMTERWDYKRVTLVDKQEMLDFLVLMA
jgi:hypothetical protein